MNSSIHQSTHPSCRDMVMLSAPVGVKLSPDGRRLAVIVRSSNWRANRYESRCEVHDLSAGTFHLLTRSGTVEQVAWVDDNTLAVLKRDDNKAQVWVYEGLIGDGWQVTQHKTGVTWFEPFADGILFQATDPEREESKTRTDLFGRFIHFEQEPSPSALYYVNFAAMRTYQAHMRASADMESDSLIRPVIMLSRLLPKPLAIRQVAPSPGGDTLYITGWPRDDLIYRRDTTVVCLTLDIYTALADHLRRERVQKESDCTSDFDDPRDIGYLGEVTELAIPRGARVTTVAPDGNKLLVAYRERDDRMYTREDLWVIDVSAALAADDARDFLGAMRNISGALDRQVLDYTWAASGIFGSYVDSAVIRVARFRECGGPVSLDLGRHHLRGELDVAQSGRMAFIGMDAETSAAVCVADPTDDEVRWQASLVRDFDTQVENWDLGVIEKLCWNSKDGIQIEGVLRKPTDFDPDKRYPLVLIIHGGPSSFSPAYLLTSEDRNVYPTVQLVNKGVLVLKPNYRGSIGRGQGFMELNVNNLGIGDLWDLESAVEHLTELGWVDPERVGCMGWSQGGYISAFAGLHSKAFKAVSVGAGISDWYTYHISNDIPDFTVDYLSGSPFRNRERYQRSAPIANLSNAKTPMLIQHGADDRRVPLSNAMELYRGLKEMDVPVELFVFPGMGHGISKPRESHAVMQQNLSWFCHYLLGEPLNLP